MPPKRPLAELLARWLRQFYEGGERVEPDRAWLRFLSRCDKLVLIAVVAGLSDGMRDRQREELSFYLSLVSPHFDTLVAERRDADAKALLETIAKGCKDIERKTDWRAGRSSGCRGVVLLRHLAFVEETIALRPKRRTHSSQRQWLLQALKHVLPKLAAIPCHKPHAVNVPSSSVLDGWIALTSTQLATTVVAHHHRISEEKMRQQLSKASSRLRKNLEP